MDESLAPGEVESDRLPLRNVVTDLKHAAQTPAKRRAIKINGIVDTVCAMAFENGLSSNLLKELIDMITLPNELDQASIGAIIRHLYPATKIPDECVIKVVGSLGHGLARARLSVQSLMLKWLIMVYDVLENKSILSQLYGPLFNLLDTIAIRAPLCHLLSLITCRKHVRPFRIQILLELARRVGNEPSLIGLIRVYKDYYPDVIVGDMTRGRASVFTHPNPEWRQRLQEIQATHSQRTQNDLPNKRDAFKVLRRGINNAGRANSVLPEVRTSRARESSTTLEEIENVNDLIRKLERIELPNQIVAVIGDPLFQNYLQLKPNETVSRRLDEWLTAFFEDQLENGNQYGTALLEMLTNIQEYSKFTKCLPLACQRYLQSLLGDWDGVTGRETILDLLTYLPLSPFEELYQTIFLPLEYCILDGDPASQITLLNFYTSLLHRWTVTLLSTTPPINSSSTINALTVHVNLLALTLLQTSPGVRTHGQVLAFYEATASLISYSSLQPHIRITTPPSTLVYTLHFSSSLCTLSRLCAILALYKRAFETAMSKPVFSSSTHGVESQAPSPNIEQYPKDYVNHFNGFLMDICNCIWRSRAFNTSDLNALGCLLPPPLLPPLTLYIAGLENDLLLSSLFSLSFSPVLCNLCISYFRDLEDKEIEAGGRNEGAENGEQRISTRHAGPVTARSLEKLGKEGGLKLAWSTYRLGVLGYLEEKGVKGIGELMYKSIKNLMGRERLV